jgi:uncharacterized protein YndB with AHSA1/START domain
MATAVIDQEQVSTFTITKEIFAKAPIELTFEAVLEEVGPGLQMPDGRSLQMKLEAWPGGRWYRDLGNNAGHLWGHVQVIKPPMLLELCGPMPMSYPALNHIQYRLKAEGDRTHLKLVHRAMGLILPEHRDGMPEGWEDELNRIRDRAERKAAESKPMSPGGNR